MFVEPLVFNSLDTVCTQRVFTESASWSHGQQLLTGVRSSKTLN